MFRRFIQRILEPWKPVKSHLKRRSATAWNRRYPPWWRRRVGLLLAPVIATTRSPVLPGPSDAAWVFSKVTDANSLTSVNLTCSSVTVTGTVRRRLHRDVRQYGGQYMDGHDRLEQPLDRHGRLLRSNTNSNYDTLNGSTCGMTYKGQSTANTLTGAMIANTTGINAAGSSGYVQFYLDEISLSGTDGWAFQVDSTGTGNNYVTCLSDSTFKESGAGWQPYQWPLTSSQLVNGLKIRFQFSGGGSGDNGRIWLDDVSVTITPGSASTTTTAMSGSNGVYQRQHPRPARGQPGKLLRHGDGQRGTDHNRPGRRPRPRNIPTPSGRPTPRRPSATRRNRRPPRRPPRRFGLPPPPATWCRSPRSISSTTPVPDRSPCRCTTTVCIRTARRATACTAPNPRHCPPARPSVLRLGNERRGLTHHRPGGQPDVDRLSVFLHRGSGELEHPRGECDPRRNVHHGRRVQHRRPEPSQRRGAVAHGDAERLRHGQVRHHRRAVLRLSQFGLVARADPGHKRPGLRGRHVRSGNDLYCRNPARRNGVVRQRQSPLARPTAAFPGTAASSR